MKNRGWLFIPAAFFLLYNFSHSKVPVFFGEGVIYFAFLVLLFLFLRKFDLSSILIPIIGGISLIIFVYGIIQKFVLFPIYIGQLATDENPYLRTMLARVETGRIFSLFSLPTLHAIVCVVLILFIFHYLLHAARKGFWFVLLILGLVNLVLTESFGGIVCLSVGVVIYLFLSRIFTFKYLAPILMVLFLFLFIVVAFRFAEAREFEPAKLRLSNWKQAVRMIGTDPLSGVGLGNYQSQVAYHTRPGEARSLFAHNFFLQFIAECGIFASLYLLILFCLFRKNLAPERIQDKIVYLAVFSTLLLYNSIDIGFYFLTAGIMGAVTLSQIYRDQHGKVLRPGIGMVMVAVPFVLITAADNLQKTGGQYQAWKDFVQAERYFAHSLSVNPLNIKASLGIAYNHYHLGDVEKARKYVDQALKLYPDSSSGNYLKSKIDFSLGRYSSALVTASIVHEKNKRDGRYKEWYEYIKNSLQAQLNQSGN